MARSSSIRNKLRLSLLGHGSNSLLPLDFEPDECVSSIEFSAELGTSDQDLSMSGGSNTSLLGTGTTAIKTKGGRRKSGGGVRGGDNNCAGPAFGDSGAGASGGTSGGERRKHQRRQRRRRSSRKSFQSSMNILLEDSDKEFQEFKALTAVEPPTLSRWESGGSIKSNIADVSLMKGSTATTCQTSTAGSGRRSSGGRRRGSDNTGNSRVPRSDRLQRSIKSSDSIPSLVQRQASMKSIRSSFTSVSTLQEKMEKVMRRNKKTGSDETPSVIRRQSTKSTLESFRRQITNTTVDTNCTEDTSSNNHNYQW